MITSGNFDGRDDFRELLIELREDAKSNRDFALSAQLRKTLNRPRRFESVYRNVVNQAEQDSKENPLAMQANGDFAKWFIEWFSNGGWQTIIEFIKQLVPLFMTPNPSHQLLMGDSGVSMEAETSDQNFEPDSC